jgi:hypothetical protein
VGIGFAGRQMVNVISANYTLAVGNWQLCSDNLIEQNIKYNVEYNVSLEDSHFEPPINTITKILASRIQYTV